MSAGAFSIGRYERDNETDIHPVDIQPETASAVLNGTANGFPGASAADVTSDISAQISGSRRSKGLHCRTVSVKFGTTAGSFPAGYKPGTTATIPVFQKSVWDSLKRGQDATYLDTACLITTKAGEKAC